MAWNLVSSFSWLVLLTTLFIIIIINKKLFKLKNGSSKPLPPGPPGWPVVGNIFDLWRDDDALCKLQSTYGPVIWLQLGSINTMVVQSAAAAEELFKKHDLRFSDRKAPHSLTALGYSQGSLAMGAYSDYVQKARRVCAAEFLAQKRVNGSSHVRQKCVDEMTEWIKRDAGGGEIQLDRFLFVTAFNIVGNIMLSRDVVDTRSHDQASDFFLVFSQFLECFARPNVADFFPVLKWMDPQGIKRNTTKYLERLIGFASEIVKERIEEKKRDTNDFLDALIDEGDAYEDGADKLSVNNITIVLLEMSFAGSETTSTTIEWGMAELVGLPKSMKKIQEEIDRVVGRTRKVEEKDLTQMPYLQATVKEILRLHPVVQMLLPRNSVEDTEYMGYFVPRNTQILVNAWAIHREPAVWADPMSFKPERFLESDIDYKGQDFKMIPFGSGRRSCLGMTLGYRMVSLTIASLLQAFEWKLGDGVELDMIREPMGFILRKKVPLKLIPCLRE